MAVTKGNTSSAQGNVSSLSWEHIVAAGANVLVVGVATPDDVIESTAVTFNTSESFTLVRRDINGSGTTTSIWRLVDPTETTANIVVTYDSKGQVSAGAVDFLGAGIPDNSVGSTPDAATSVSDTVTGSAADNFIFDVVSKPGGTPTAGVDQTQEWNRAQGGKIGAASTQDGEDGGVMSWSSSSDDWAHTACRIPSAAGQTVVVGLASETNTAFVNTPQRTYDIGLSTETNTGFLVTIIVVVLVALSTETDTGFAVDHSKVLQVGLSSETDTAFAVSIVVTPQRRVSFPIPHYIFFGGGASSPGTIIVTGFSTETDTAFVVEHSKTLQIGLSTETDTGFVVVPERTYTVGLSTETDTAFIVEHSKTLQVDLSTETDTAFVVEHFKTLQVGLTSETDTAFAITINRTIQVGLATEIDTAFGVTAPGKIGLASETDTAFVVIPERIHAVDLSNETDTAFACTPLRTHTVGLSTETDTAFVVEHSKTLQIGLSTETDTGFVVVPERTYTVVLSTETDTAFIVEHSKTLQVGLSTETDTAFVVEHFKTLQVGLTSETDTAFIILRIKTVQVGLSIETDTAFNIILEALAVALASEIDTATSITIDRGINLSIATVIDIAFIVEPVKIIPPPFVPKPEFAVTRYLTSARGALWDAIDNWPALMTSGESELIKKYRFDTTSNMLPDMQPTSLSELPALAIFPMDMVPEPLLSNQQIHPYPLQLHFWTKDWVLPLSERLLKNLIDAAYQSKHLITSDTEPVIQVVTGFPPRIGPVTFQRVQLGKEEKSRAIYGTFILVLRQRFNPHK